MTVVACIVPVERGAHRPAIHLEIERRRLAAAADWQAAIIAECRRHRTLNQRLVDWLRRAGFLARCTFLASDTPVGPLRFRYIGEPTIRSLGRAWARQALGRPHVENPHTEFPDALAPLYVEAIEGGEPVHNRVTMRGPWAEGKPYTHVLCGWKAADGRRAVLSAIALH